MLDTLAAHQLVQYFQRCGSDLLGSGLAQGRFTLFLPGLLQGKTILITGGGTGLGRAMGEAFLSHGARLVITSRREDVILKAAAEMGAKGSEVFPFVCDVKESIQVDEMLERALAQVGRIDVLVNNAAANFISPTEDLSVNAFKLVVQTVLMGSVHCTLGLGKHWIEKQQPGVVLNILTTYAATGSGFVVPSACAKAGVEAMMKSLAFEWAKYKIRFVGIAPGPFPTEGAFERIIPKEELGPEATSLVEANHPWRRFGRPQELADLASYLVSDMADYINGETIRIDGGLLQANAGEFNALSKLKPEQWKKIRKQTRFSKAVRSDQSSSESK